MFNNLRRFARIPTKDFKIKNDSFRINKFGVHQFKTKKSLDTGYGFTYSIVDNESTPHQQFLDSFKFSKEHEPIIDYIKSMEQEKDLPESFAKVKITIINHAHNTIFLNPDSKFIVDGISLKDYATSDAYSIEEISRPTTVDLPENKFSDYNMTSAKFDLGTIILPGNQYAFVWDNGYDIFTRRGIEFTANKNLERKDFPINFLPHAPGGVSNLGSYKDGKKYERWFEGGKTYHLNITVSPGIKLKANATFQRTFHADYPYLEKDKKRKMTDYSGNVVYEPDALVSVVNPASGLTYTELINKREWNHEDVFGINFDWSEF